MKYSSNNSGGLWWFVALTWIVLSLSYAPAQAIRIPQGGPVIWFKAKLIGKIQKQRLVMDLLEGEEGYISIHSFNTDNITVDPYGLVSRNQSDYYPLHIKMVNGEVHVTVPDNYEFPIGSPV